MSLGLYQARARGRWWGRNARLARHEGFSPRNTCSACWIPVGLLAQELGEWEQPEKGPWGQPGQCHSRRAVPSAARPPVLSPLCPLAGSVSVSEGTQGGGTRHKRGSQGLWWGTAVWLCTLRAPPGPPGLHEPPPPRTLCSPPAAH